MPPIAMRNPLRFDQVPTHQIAGPTLDAPRPFPSWLHAGKKWGEQELIRSGVQPGFAQSDIKLTFSPASIRKCMLTVPSWIAYNRRTRWPLITGSPPFAKKKPSQPRITLSPPGALGASRLQGAGCAGQSKGGERSVHRGAPAR